MKNVMKRRIAQETSEKNGWLSLSELKLMMMIIILILSFYILLWVSLLI